MASRVRDGMMAGTCGSLPSIRHIPSSTGRKGREGKKLFSSPTGVKRWAGLALSESSRASQLCMAHMPSIFMYH